MTTVVKTGLIVISAIYLQMSGFGSIVLAASSPGIEGQKQYFAYHREQVFLRF